MFNESYELTWSGKPFTAKTLGIDTETTLVDLKREVPVCVLATVSDGYRHVVIRRTDIPNFLAHHTNRHWVCHNAAFDYAVIRKLLLDGRYRDLADGWQDVVESNRLHDTMLLDMLCRLASGDGESGMSDDKLFPRALDKVADSYGITPRVDKDNPYRKRFSELQTRDNWGDSDLRGFFDYAVADTVVTIRLYDSLRDHALRLSRHVDGATQSLYGVLTEAVQVKAAIALGAAGRNGFGIDFDKAKSLELACRQRYETALSYLQERHPALFKRYKRKNSGGLKFTDKSATVQLDCKELIKVLKDIGSRLGIEPPLSPGIKRDISRSVKAWRPYLALDPFLQAWHDLSLLAKELGFYAIFNSAQSDGYTRIYPAYQILVRTGRSACVRPNAQQFPRDPEFRKIFKAGAGTKLYTVDYSFLELVTLATLCEKRFGRSALAEALRAGTDPHEHTAAVLRGLSLAEFRALRNTDPDSYERDRQSAKALNFGLPGGLGDKKLVDYSAAQFGVHFTVEQAATFRVKLIKEVYPEIGRYLADTTCIDLAGNLCLPEEVVEGYVCQNWNNPGQTFYCLSKVVRGDPTKVNGDTYSQSYQDRLWHTLHELVKLTTPGKLPADLIQSVRDRVGSPVLYDKLFTTRVTTLTGRVRAGCGYTQARNTGFQALAADGAKLAMWRLTAMGYKVVGFIHDEIIIELEPPYDTAQIDAILIEEMSKVLDHRVPVKVKGVLADYWGKK